VKTLLYQWMKKNITLLANTGSLVGTTAVTSVLGFVYWWAAARQFPLESVGLASAAISAMMLLGGFCVLGLGTLLITELPRQPEQAASLVSTALLVVGGAGIIAGAAFALVAPYISASFLPLRANVLAVITFAAGVGLTSVTLVLDQALVGLLRGSTQLWRNSLFAVSKLLLLVLAGFWLSAIYKTGMLIYAAWGMGNVLSFLTLFGALKRKQSWSLRTFLPRWGLVRTLGISALQHHLLNMTLQAPTLLLPLVVTAMLSAKMNAWFYVAWMIACFVFVVPNSLTTVLHAMNSAKPTALGHKMRITMGIAVATCVIVNIVLQLATKQVLGLFGHTYADQATWCLRILSLAAFPLIIKNHYVSICRIQDRITQAMLGMVPGGLLELGAAALGAHFAGLTGLSLGWLCAICLESLFMLPAVYKVFRFVEAPSAPALLDKEGVSLRRDRIYLRRDPVYRVH
jgi:O-antigen/teichoic acid export membrane protein